MRVIYTVIFLCCIISAAGQVTITFRNSSYSGDTIKVLTIADYITGTQKELASGIVDGQGNFLCRADISKPVLIKIPLYFFEGLLYAEPGNNYEIVLPKKTPVPVHAEISPFFTPMPFFAYLPADKPDELNNLIYTFDSVYNDYVSKNSNRLLYEGYKSKADTFITRLNNEFGKYSDRYFSTYLQSKIAMLHYITKKRDLYYIVNYYLNSMPVSVENDAYMELFNNLFRDFFRFYSLKKEGETLFDDVAKAKSPHAIRQTMSMNPVFNNDTLIELIMLKGIHDAFFPGNENVEKEFPHIQLYLTLDSIRLQNRYWFTSATSGNISEKARYRYNTIDYNRIKLLNCNDEEVDLKALHSKYVYMAFYDTRNYTCQKELKLFSKIAKDYEKNFSFVIIIVNKDKKDFGTFCKKYNFSFPVYYAGQNSEIFKRLDIKATPQYLIFDPYGYCEHTNAPGPSENIEGVLKGIIER